MRGKPQQHATWLAPGRGAGGSHGDEHHVDRQDPPGAQPASMAIATGMSVSVDHHPVSFDANAHATRRATRSHATVSIHGPCNPESLIATAAGVKVTRMSAAADTVRAATKTSARPDRRAERRRDDVTQRRSSKKGLPSQCRGPEPPLLLGVTNRRQHNRRDSTSIRDAYGPEMETLSHLTDPPPGAGCRVGQRRLVHDRIIPARSKMSVDWKELL